MSRPGYQTISPYLVCRDGAAAIEWYCKHFGATERYRLSMPDGALAHAEVEFNGSVFMISDEFSGMGVVSPHSLMGSPVSLVVYVDNVDAQFAAMIKDGAEELVGIKDHFHGDRSGKLKDPFGHIWHVSTNIAPLDPEGIVKAFDAGF